MMKHSQEMESVGLLNGDLTSNDDGFWQTDSQSRSLQHLWRTWVHPVSVRRLLLIRALRFAIVACAGLALSFVLAPVFLAIFLPVYTSPPAHYEALRARVASSTDLGRGNVNGQRVFIAANIVDAELIRGSWGQSIKELVDLIGPDKAFVSIYENDSGQDTDSALDALAQQLSCEKSIVGGAHLDLDDMKTTRLADGGVGVKRIEYLAQVRNHALRPLGDPAANGTHDKGFALAQGHFDRVLFLNDILFDPVDALQLLFSTNADEKDGNARYEAACAADFMSVTNYYDNFATRDYEGFTLGYGPGFRVFPWFSSAGQGRSRRETLAGRDAVAVRSCWGGMVAFDAKYFQQTQDQEPVRFRSELEPFWDASECCLVHADITQRYLSEHPDASDAGIFLNPFVRVAYHPKTYSWRKTLARFEHGFSLLQSILTLVNQYPEEGERRLEEAGQPAYRRVYTFSGTQGFYSVQSLAAANPGGFCGVRGMSIMRPDFREAHSRGEQYFDHYPAP